MNTGITADIEIIGCHAEGEVGDVIVGGVEPPPGDTVWDQAQWITGHTRHVLDPRDPWPQGYRLSDTWPKMKPGN